MPHTCSLPGCSAVAIAHCASCSCAWYCSREHQRKGWPRHRKHCKLVRAALPDVPGGAAITFLGQSAGGLKELSQVNVALRAAVAPRAGWRGLPDVIKLKAGAGEGTYCALAQPVDMAAIRKQWPSEALVVPRRQCQLDLDYCVGTSPSFLLQARAGARGFTAADLAGATARAYQWCYTHEDAVTTPPSMGMMLNRGPTAGAWG